ncbi:prepilin-type N-terminal cleavage/methylation domain-containing protein [Catenovulum sp. SM1970]|uniref:prepilin-type N-terminal cleavage/methylation domain-containing protein n=1 Tax=Marinifaba aquimaris TaxID=2741323 RepID=UPI001574C338|nr:prepilin-type N-terminal cleavage/methylation domain-containing protein [Marinifaba aquimaris]NTS76280.1 prepilin-type N-terminal cleavage/methylation domain-containing protein [Marinifaba aquimaris]
MKNTHSTTQGFTLIELVSVIVIIGIVAVTTAPKFVDIADDAKVTSLEAVAASMKSGLTLIYAKAQINGQNTGSGSIEINGETITLYNGYPAVNGRDTFVDINNQVLAWLDIDAVDRNTARRNRSSAKFFTDKSTSNNQIYIFFTEDYSQKGGNFRCQIRYENPVTVTPAAPLLTIQTDQC